MIYLDNSATTKPHDDVLKSFQAVNTTFFANPSSIHKFGGKTEELLTEARKQVSHYFKVTEEEIIFTSGGTEGNNLAIFGVASYYKTRGKHIITTEIEHPSIYETCMHLKEKGFSITTLKVDQNGLIDLDDLKEAITDETILVTLGHVNSEIGTIQNISQIGHLLQKYPKIIFHVDHVQGVGKVPLYPYESGVDLCTMSGHKIHGLKGTGALFIRKGIQLEPLLFGGNQEKKIRAGTENVAGAVSFARALRLIEERYENEHEKIVQMQKVLITRLKQINRVKINTNPAVSAPHIVNFSVEGFKPEVIIHSLGEKEIYISTKSACSSRDEEASRIVLACFQDEKRAKAALRVSLSYDNTLDEIYTFIEQLEKTIAHLEKVLE